MGRWIRRSSQKKNRKKRIWMEKKKYYIWKKWRLQVSFVSFSIWDVALSKIIQLFIENLSCFELQRVFLLCSKFFWIQSIIFLNNLEFLCLLRVFFSTSVHVSSQLGQIYSIILGLWKRKVLIRKNCGRNVQKIDFRKDSIFHKLLGEKN